MLLRLHAYFIVFNVLKKERESMYYNLVMHLCVSVYACVWYLYMSIGKRGIICYY